MEGETPLPCPPPHSRTFSGDIERMQSLATVGIYLHRFVSHRIQIGLMLTAMHRDLAPMLHPTCRNSRSSTSSHTLCVFKISLFVVHVGLEQLDYIINCGIKRPRAFRCSLRHTFRHSRHIYWLHFRRYRSGRPRSRTRTIHQSGIITVLAND